jgi:multiple antibiotic resistance protein
MGVVPLGIPLVVRPAVLTTIIVTVDSYGYIPTITALVVNLFIVWIVFLKSNFIYRVMGEGGFKAFAKVASLILAAIAVMMIKRGFTDIVLYI